MKLGLALLFASGIAAQDLGDQQTVYDLDYAGVVSKITENGRD